MDSVRTQSSQIAACDICSLDVMLCELLTGVTPFDQEAFRKAGLDEIRRIIRETSLH